MKIRSVFFIFLLFTLNVGFAQETDYDVVVVGAGPAGLSCAYELNDYNVLILEKSNRIGGRVFTKKHENIYYDLGAAFAYHPGMLPFNFTPSEIIMEKDSIGLYYENHQVNCNYVLECLYKSGEFSLDEIEILKEYDKENGIDFTIFSQKQKDIMNAFFNVVQGGRMQDYNPKRQRDAFAQYTTAHYERGNSEIIYEYKSLINAKIQLKSEVTKVVQEKDRVKIEYNFDGQQKTVYSKVAMVCTPGNITKYIVADLEEKVYSILDGIKWGNYAVMAIGLETNKIPNFKYIVTPYKPISNVIQNKTKNDEQRVYLFNFANLKADAIKDLSEQKIKRICLESIESMFGIDITADKVLFSSFQYWNAAAVVVDSDYYKDWDESIFNPKEGIFLAGDYLDIYGYPLGMKAAIFSGQYAAKKALKYLNPEKE